MMVLFLAMVLALGHAVPVSNSPNEVEKYLPRFGYLIKDNTRIGSNNTENELKEALPKLQKFSGVAKTGVVDDEVTLKPIESRRCGVDVKNRSDNDKKIRGKRSTLLNKWNKLYLTWSIKKPIPYGLAYDEVRKEINRALNVWAKHTKLVFVEKINCDDVDIVMSFQLKEHGDYNDFDGMGGVVAHAFYPNQSLTGDVHFDADEDWTTENSDISSKTHLFSTAVHEIGHSLGLGHTSTNDTNDSLMFLIYKQLPTDYELPPYDRQNIQKLYGAPVNNRRVMYYRPATTTTAIPKWKSKQRQMQYRFKYYSLGSLPYYEIKPQITSTTTRRSNTNYEETRGCHLGKYDAVSLLSGSLWIFSGEYFWMATNIKKFSYKESTRIDGYFRFNKQIDHVDAVYERSDGNVVFFIDREYYVFNRPNVLIYSGPLTDFGLPHDLEKIDAAMIWKRDEGTYFISGKNYWKFNENSNRVERDYPRDVRNLFTDVHWNIDTAFHANNGTTYFFKGRYFWQFDDARRKIVDINPKLSSQYWMGCPRNVDHTSKAHHRVASTWYRRNIPRPYSTCKGVKSIWTRTAFGDFTTVCKACKGSS